MDEPLLPTTVTEIAPTSSSHKNLRPNTRLTTLRSNSAPSVFTFIKEKPGQDDSPSPELPSEPTRFPTQKALLGVALYVSVGITTFLITGGYKGHMTAKPVDAVYYLVVTLCTIGYGDIVPDSTFAKLFTCGFILVGFGFVDTVLNGVVIHICERQEAVLLSAMDESRLSAVVQGYVMDGEKGRVRIRTKVALASGVVVCCIGVGAAAAHFLEELSWVDSFYLAVTSVTTVGYGDYAFTTLEGRIFAAVWLLVSTLAVARAFLYLAELRIDRRNRQTAKWVLQKKVTLGDLVAADLDNDGSISKSEYVIYKLKEMGKVSEKDIIQIYKQFDSLEHSNRGKITLADILLER